MQRVYDVFLPAVWLHGNFKSQRCLATGTCSVPLRIKRTSHARFYPNAWGPNAPLMCVPNAEKMACAFLSTRYGHALFAKALVFVISNHYYPTLLRRVQITRETSTNITGYLYSSHSSRPRKG